MSPCNTCHNRDLCLSCLASSSTFYWSQNSSCLPVCPQGYYGDTSDRLCKTCVDPCLECTSVNLCASCLPSSNTYLYNSRCIPECPSGFFANTSSHQCQPCSPPCRACTNNSGTVCSSCVQGFFYLGPGQCVNPCPAPYITSLVYATCVNCTAPCLVCSQSACSRCEPTHALYHGGCVRDCLASFYARDQGGFRECTPCPAECLTCSNGTFCTRCSSGYFWVQGWAAGKCGQACPAERPILE